MASESSRPTPLGVARARFVDGLPRKAAELRGSIALLAATPGEEKPREELRRRLHALYASAQVFQIGPLTAALKDAIARLDRARDAKASLSDDDVEALALLASTLPVLGQAEPSGPGEPGLGEGSLTRSAELSAPGPSTADVELPRPSKLPSTAPRASAPPGHRSALPRDAKTPAMTPSPEPRRPESVRSGRSTLRGIPASERPTAPPPDAPAERAPEARPESETVVSVLVIDAAEWQAKVRATLPAERFEVLGASDPEEGLRLARSCAPDVVMIDHAILVRPGAAVVRRLRDDPLTDFVPVLAVVPTGMSVDPVAIRELGADDVLTKPFDAADLGATLRRLAAGPPPRGALEGLSGEHTIDEVAKKIAEEVRRGLVESADRGRDLKVPLGDGAEVLAAAWSAIGRVRAHLASRSGGRLHFHDTRAPGVPSFLALSDEEDTPEPKGAPAPVSLRERQVIVVDDDPAVVWFFAGLLREEGAIVEEAGDGAEALDKARRKRPDLVISDILMPRLDGFALTRELKRDPALADVPVILLSWKEDFLQRMREVKAGASGYLRKEAAAGQILECVRDVLRPRARLEAQLRAGGDVRGRLERTGILPLIVTVAQHRPSARITVRDAWNLFEIDIRPDERGKGRMVDLTRTASDGSFSRGPRVVVPLLGATVGRFTVVDADTAVRASIKEPLDAVLKKGAAQIGALVDAVSGKGLTRAAKVGLDEDVIASLLRSSPEPMTAIVEALRGGKGPRQLLLEGTIAPDELEAVMLDLARQGAITSVHGEGGEDRIAFASAARGEIELPIRAPSLAPPGPGAGLLEPPSLPIGAPRAPASEPADEGLSWLETEQSTKEIVAEAHRLASEPPPAKAPPAAEVVVATPAKESTAEETAATSGGSASPMLELDGPEHPPIAGRTPVPPPAATDLTDDEDEDEEEIDDREAESVPPVAAAPAVAPVRPAPAVAGRKQPTANVAPSRPAAPAEGGMGVLGWAFLLALLGVVGFVSFRTFLQPPSDPGAPAVAAVPSDDGSGDTAAAVTPDPTGAESAGATGAGTPGTATGTGTGTGSGEPAAPSSLAGYGRIEPGIADGFGVAAADGQGLVVLEPSPAGPVRVRIADRERVVGAEPIALALPEGVHEVAFVEGDDLAFRFVRVQAGHTRYVPAP